MMSILSERSSMISNGIFRMVRKDRTSTVCRISFEVSATPSRSSSSDRVVGMSGNAIHLAWDRVIARAGLNDLRFHDLRHEAISWFFELGMTIPEVASISGHRNPTMLFRYAHASSTAVF